MNDQSQTPSNEPVEQTKLQAAMPYILAGGGAIVGAALYPEIAKTAVIFVLVLSLLVFVHEWGHYQFARWGGMKVNRFAIGFPPWVFTVRRNNIDYSIGALPIGGMVDIAGLGSEEEMIQTGKGETDGGSRQAQLDSYRHRNPDAPHGTKNFQDASLGWRFLALFAGPLMNFIYAIVMFIIIFSVAGYPDVRYKAKVETVTVGSPAEKAGVKAGDLIISVGGKEAKHYGDVTKAIRGGDTKPTFLEVERRNSKSAQTNKIKLPITPIMADVDKDGKNEPSIGVAFGNSDMQSVSYIKLGPVEAVKVGFLESVGTGLGIIDMVKRLVMRQLSAEEFKQIGGPVKIAETTGKVSKFGFWFVMLMSAKLSVNLGLMNLLPLPALDGGRIMFLGYEFVMRRPIDPRKEGLIHMAGMAMLLLFMLLITFKDVLSLRG